LAKSEQNTAALPRISRNGQPTIADHVFDEMRMRILRLELPPLAKISETEVANQMGVSRQPVREAFKRLAQLGFLVIRPQSGTTVSLISEAAVLQALYIRRALEEQTCRTACSSITNPGLDALSSLIDQQKQAVEKEDKEGFHALDDAFHREICIQAGVGYVWDLILENKAHMDRVRLITLNSPSQKAAYEEHVVICEALHVRKPEQAANAMAKHLLQILNRIEAVRAENHDWFLEHNE
jgi:DNA-binding GntR family transcriptional regulator